MKITLILAILFFVCNLWADAKSKEVLEKAIKAKGGLKALKKFESISYEAEGNLFTNKLKKQITLSCKIVFPDKYYIFMNYPGMVIKRIINKDNTHLVMNNQPMKQTKQEVKQTLARIYRSEMFFLKRLGTKEIQTTYREETTWEGMAVHKIDIVIKGVSVSLFVEIKSFRIVGKSYELQSVFGVMKIEEIYRDYRTVEGVVFPFRALTRINGKAYMDISIKKLLKNPKIDKDIFKIE